MNENETQSKKKNNRQADNTKKSPVYNQKDCGYETCALIKSATQKKTRLISMQRKIIALALTSC